MPRGGKANKSLSVHIFIEGKGGYYSWTKRNFVPLWLPGFFSDPPQALALEKSVTALALLNAICQSLKSMNEAHKSGEKIHPKWVLGGFLTVRFIIYIVDNKKKRYIPCPDTGGRIGALVKANGSEQKVSIFSKDRERKTGIFLRRNFHCCMTDHGHWRVTAKGCNIRHPSIPI